MPGVRGSAPGNAASPFDRRFEALLEQLRAVGSGHPDAPAGSPVLTGPSRIRQRAVAPRVAPRKVVPRNVIPKGAPPGSGRSARAARPDAAPPMAPAKRALAASIRHAAVHAGVHPGLSVAVARAESSLNPKARSFDGLSSGTFQVLPSTAAEMRRKIAAGTVVRPPGTDDVALGVGYLRYLHDLFGRDARLGRSLRTVAVDDPSERQRFAVAAFNAGEGAVARAQAKAAAAGGDPTRFEDVRGYLPRTTRFYVERVTAFAREEGIPEPVRV